MGEISFHIKVNYKIPILKNKQKTLRSILLIFQCDRHLKFFNNIKTDAREIVSDICKFCSILFKANMVVPIYFILSVMNPFKFCGPLYTASANNKVP